MKESGKSQSKQEDRASRPGRGVVPGLRLAVTALFLGLVGVVAWYQLRPDRALTEKALREQSRLVYVPACRGELQDRMGTPLNVTRPSYAIVIRPDQVRDPRDTRATTLVKLEERIAALAADLGPEAYASLPSRERISRHLRQEPAMPLELWEDVSAETRARWLTLRRQHPATELMLSWKREYLLPETAPQLRGSVRRTTPKGGQERRYWNANAPELSGATGMERVLDYLLGGQSGTELLQTDVLSYRASVLDYEPAAKGDDCRLSIYLPAQRKAEELFRQNGLSGAVVALEMETGQVLVMHSAPSTPLGSASKGGGGDMNRALAGYYPPGSVMKPLLALYALEKGIGANIRTVDCPGYYPITSKRKLGCSHVHGKQDMKEAIANSCNAFFCTLGSQFTQEQWNDFAELFGFGEKTGGDLSEQEIAGVPFCPKWVKSSRKNDRAWHPGDAANGSIGQGGWIVTPMQLALAMNFALTGKLLSPRYYLQDDIRIRKQHDFPAWAQTLVKSGMEQCVLTGTGQSLKTPTVSILAKTGTAETGRGKKPHAWMVAAAPANNPKYLVVVTAEHGGGGGRVAGPIAREVLLSLLNLDKNP